MIGSLRGQLMAKQAPQIIIDCQGVGYEVETPMSTFLDLPAIGEPLFLHTHLVVRDDAHMLYGFATDAERSLFRMLLKISGVGAKMGLAILSTMSVDDFRRCVEYEDAATLVKIPGVGKKTAERLIIEMRDRIDKTVGAARSMTVSIAA
ncbi:MAG: Holliday junction branch migration protein RuvA, partial [Gammaproteobacteria bacterium]|nr:Holliday junction branch migration protein RuvA [Gammaproteobacteria bacterium]